MTISLARCPDSLSQRLARWPNIGGDLVKVDSAGREFETHITRPQSIEFSIVGELDALQPFLDVAERRTVSWSCQHGAQEARRYHRVRIHRLYTLDIICLLTVVFVARASLA